MTEGYIIALLTAVGLVGAGVGWLLKVMLRLEHRLTQIETVLRTGNTEDFRRYRKAA